MSVLYGKVRIYGDAGQTITITDGKSNTKTVQTTGQEFTDIALPGMEEYTLSNGGMEETIILNIGDFKECEMSFIPPANLEDASWSIIQNLVRTGRFGNYYNVGDTKTITLTTNEQLTLKVASINDGTGSAGTYYPANTVDFISVELMADSHRMNATDTNVGGWNSSEMRTYLNNTVYPTLPSDLKNIVINKTHMRIQGNQSTTLVSADDKLWLPTEWEVFGAATYGSEPSNYNKHYTIFSNTNSRIKYKKAAPSTAVYWWLSSPYASDATRFCSVHTNGSANFSSASVSIGVALGLRIG